MSWQETIKKNRTMLLKERLIEEVDKDIQYIDSGKELNPQHMKARLNHYKRVLEMLQ